MTFFRLLLRNLFYHWRGNLAVFLGITLGSAVMTGALLVGDSLRGSLRALTLDQLGWVEQAMVPGRFFRADLAKEIEATKRAPVILLQGNAAVKGADARVGKVNVIGVDASFWSENRMPMNAEFWNGEEAGVILNRTLARALGVQESSTIELYLPKTANVPGETLMGQKRDVIQKLTVRLSGVWEDEGMVRFSLKPTPEPVRNAFVPIRYLQQKLDLAGRANALLVAGGSPDVHRHLTLDDWGLRYRSPTDRADAFFRLLAGNSTEPQLKRVRWRDVSGKTTVNRIPDELVELAEKNGGNLKKDDVIEYYKKRRDYYVLESRRMLLEPAVVRALDTLAPKRADANQPPRWNLTPMLIYLADTITDGKLETPYSIVASDEAYRLADDEMVLMDWPGSPFSPPRVKPGTKLKLTYYAPDEKNHLQLREAEFKVKAVEKIEGAFDDPDLTPEVPEVTDQLDITKWKNPPFPYDAKRNKPADVAYSVRYRTTPRVHVNLKTAQKLWGNRFGDLTSVQVRWKGGAELPETLPAALLAELKPEQGGFVFQKVREQALNASAGATDFGVLFLSFSFFLIVSALLLVGLLVRLNLDRRAGEMGLLLATGWTKWRVHWLLLGEGALLSVVGALVGQVGAALYASLMLKFLSANWPGGEGLNFLTLHADEHSIIHGFFASVLVSLITLWSAIRVLGNLSPRSLLSGQTTQTIGLAESKPGWSRWLIPIGAIGALALVVTARSVTSHEAQAGCFFGSGALMLTACLAAVWNGLHWTGKGRSPQPSLLKLGIRNAGRHAVRSVLTVGLLATASFLIVAVESFHKDTDKHFHEKTGGSGGFALYAEGPVPVYEDLNQTGPRRDLRLDTAEMVRVEIYPCRVQPGDDASCLNLYKPLKPRVVGVTPALIKRGGFQFTATAAKTDDERANPWLLLQAKDDDAIPAIIDANTAEWILKVKLGDTIDVKNDKGEDRKLRIVALLEESIFQSEVLVAESRFLELYPQQAGYSFLLVDTADADAEKVREIEKQMSKAFAEINMDVQTTASRLQGYLAVENTYLATFQALGGLGLILGAAGLAIVLLRGVWERRAELALLRALGFTSGQLASLVLIENVFLLVLGLAAGTLSALLAVAPHLAGAGAQVLWLRIAMLLGAVLAVGLVSAALAVWSTLKTPVLTALRRE